MDIDLKVAQLLVSRVCHDLAGGVGALSTGAELLAEEQGLPDDGAIDLIAMSAKQTTARLKFLRMAFGLGSGQSGGQDIPTHELCELFSNYVEGGRVSVVWESPNVLIDLHAGKLLLNLCLIACEALPRGGDVEVTISEVDGRLGFGVAALSEHAHLISEFQSLICKIVDTQSLTPRNVHAHFTAVLAAELRAALEVVSEDGQGVRLAALLP